MLKPYVVESSGFKAVRKKCVTVFADGWGLAPPTTADVAWSAESEMPTGAGEVAAGAAIAAARVYADSIADGAIDRDRAGQVPYPELAALDASGLLAITVPAANGGPDKRLSELLLALSDVLLRHPIAVQAAFASLAAEGRRFAETPEGGRCKEDLAASELFDRVRLVWRSLGMHAFVEQPTEILPSFTLASCSPTIW